MSFARLRAHAANLPGATRDIKWGADECYSVGGKMFAVFGIERGRPRNLSFKVDAERFLELTDRDGIVPAPYLARAHWVLLERADALSADAAKALVGRSHALVAAKLTKKVREAALSGKA
jgi:predicted DNA-binding protein (MmcQ/YjbR family)